MTWTYSGDPASSPLDEVRFLLGDTAQTVQSLSDQEINWLLAQQDPANTYWAAADAAEMLSTKYVRLSGTMKKVGDLELQTDYAAQAAGYKALAQKLLRGRTEFSIGAPVMGDTTCRQFSIGMMDDPMADGEYGLRLLGGGDV